MHEFGVLVDDALKKDLAIKIIKENLLATDSQYQQVMNAIEYCFDEANSRQERFKQIKNGPEMVVGQANCNPITGFMMDCVERYMLRVKKIFGMKLTFQTFYCFLF
jgi:hypothetical protein